MLESGGAPMSPQLHAKLCKLLSRSAKEKNTNQPSSLPETISEREKEILQHTVSGLDAKRIADILKITVFTRRKHIANIYEKLHVQSKAQIIKLAHNNRWFNL